MQHLLWVILIEKYKPLQGSFQVKQTTHVISSKLILKFILNMVSICKIMTWYVKLNISVISKSPWTFLKLDVFRIEIIPIAVPASHFLITEYHIPSVELVEVPPGHILRLVVSRVTGTEDESVHICKWKKSAVPPNFGPFMVAHIAKKTIYYNLIIHH